MSYVTYTATGPWTNGNPPGISAAFLGAVEAFLTAGWFDSAITSNGSGVLTAAGLIVGSSLLSLSTPYSQSFNGSTSGTLTINEYMVGTGLKVILCNFNNYKNTGAAHTFTLNTAFTTALWAINMGGNGLNFLVGSTSQTINCLTTLGSTASGATTSATNLLQYSIGQVTAAVNGLKEPGANGSAATGIFVIVGY